MRDRSKRRQIARTQYALGIIHYGERFVRIDPSRAMAWKVFITGKNAAGLESARNRGAKRRDLLRVVAERTRSNDGITRIEG
jgi:hypothetical protein